MKATLTPIASAVAFALIGTVAHAQQATAQEPEKKAPARQVAQAPQSAASAAQATPTAAVQVAQAQTGAAQAAAAAPSPDNTVIITGIRGSLQQSLNQKRAADTRVDVITAEDIGKMPDKNVADSLQRLPGVTISSAGANEGGFDENDRVSMRGTNPSYTQTLINGHPVSSGDWFVLNQSANAGRSVSYSLLPSELVSKVVVHKSSEASLVEGGVAGSVNIVTRKPLEFRKALTLEAAAGAVHADLPNKTDPQFNALVNWRNEARTVGVLFQAFSEKRHLRRDGVEVLGYNQIAPGSAVAQSNPDLADVWYPRSIGAALFEQERERTGGLLDLQFKPSANLTLDLTAMSSEMKASNYNRNYLLHAPFFLNEGAGQAPQPGYVVRNGTLVQASFAADPSRSYSTYDQISRPDEKATTQFFNFAADWRASDALSFHTKLGLSKGTGETPSQHQASWDQRGGGAWKLNGVDSAPDFSIGTPASSPAGSSLDWLWGAQNVDIRDKDEWAQIDAEYAIDKGMLTTLKFGARTAQHTRTSEGVLGRGPKCSDGSAFTWGATWCTNPAASPDYLPNWGTVYQNYPGDFGDGLGGNFPRNVWYFSPEVLAAAHAKFGNVDPKLRALRDWDFGLKEKSHAAYVQANLEGSGWRGNVGLRVVQTKEHVLRYVAVPENAQGAIVGSAFGAYLPIYNDNSYTDVLPSLNLRVDLAKDMVARLALSKTMTRADYSALAGATTLTPPAARGDLGSGNGSNPDLKPIRSTNFDVNFEWYFAPRALLSAGAFYMDLKNYVGLGQERKQFRTFDQANPQGYIADYVLTVPVNSSGKVKGIELAYEQPLMGNFGIAANYTYADGKEKGGGPLVGTSRNTYNLSAYYEDDRFSARVAYNYRSAFYSGLDRSTAFNQDDFATLAASIGYKFSDQFSVHFDGMNLNEPTLKYYALNKDQPRSIYKNGRQYYLMARVKF